MLFDSVVIGCDHGGLALKEALVAYCRELGVDVTDCGTFTPDSVDYPVYADKVCRLVLAKPNAAGILCCGTGIGMSLAANKVRGIRAAAVSDCFTAEATRQHNDANVLCMGARTLGPGLALKIVDIFLDTPFSGDERHVRRIAQIED